VIKGVGEPDVPGDPVRSECVRFDDGERVMRCGTDRDSPAVTAELDRDEAGIGRE
jgi:hypothetical protein